MDEALDSLVLLVDEPCPKVGCDLSEDCPDLKLLRRLARGCGTCQCRTICNRVVRVYLTAKDRNKAEE